MPESHSAVITHPAQHDEQPLCPVTKTKKVAKWYHGGVASAMAATCTHPLDTLKVGSFSWIVKSDHPYCF